MRPVNEWDESDLLALIRDEVKESLSLDYKRSAALSKGSNERNSLSKDVSAFANSAGGVLIYGMIENGHVATSIDVGVDRNQITKEWLESVIKTVIHPTIDGLLIRQIGLPAKGADMVAYVLDIAQATSRAPHQAYDHKYYKRFNFESTPMEDYEVRDLMRRSIEYGKKYGAAWDLHVEVRRLIVSIRERSLIDSAYHWPRDQLKISVSNALRSSGNALVLLSKKLRGDTASFIEAVDAYNAIIETADPGQHDKARLTTSLKHNLESMLQCGESIAVALALILSGEP